MRLNGLTVLITWLLLNAIWTGALRTKSTVDVMSHDGSLVLTDTISVPDMFDLGRTTRLVIYCDYDAEQGIEASNITLSHTDPAGSIEQLWSGETGSQCPDIEVAWTGGPHSLRTSVSRNGSKVVPAHDAVSGEVSIDMWVFEPISQEGYIFFNILGALLFISDKVVRRWLEKRRASRIRNVSLHEQRRREEWRQLNRSIEGGDAVDVEDLLVPETSGGDLEFDSRMRRRAWADESVDEIGDEQLLAADDTRPFEERLGEGDLSHLRGEPKIDPKIRTVGDLMRRLFQRE